MPTVALPPKVRAVLYYVVFVLGLVVLVMTAVFGAVSDGVWPVWFKAFAAGSAAFASALGLTAASNTPISAPRHAADADGDGQFDYSEN